MGINTKQVRVRLVAVAVAVLCVLPYCTASLCPPGLQYWSNKVESCVNCSRCDASAKLVVLRPCQAHADTVCGPISDLDIDWSWLKHKHQGKHHEKTEEKHHGKGHKHHLEELDDTPQKHDEFDDDYIEAPIRKHDLDFVKKTSKHKHHDLDDIDETPKRKHHDLDDIDETPKHKHHDLDDFVETPKRKHHDLDDFVETPKRKHLDLLDGILEKTPYRKHHDLDDDFVKKTTIHKHHSLDDDFDEKSTVNKHHGLLDDDIVENAPKHHSILDDDVETLPPITHLGDKHHKQKKVFEDEDFEEKHSRNHHLSSENFFPDDLKGIISHDKIIFPPPPPLDLEKGLKKSSEDLEKEWKEWLIQSKNRLQHRKDDLLKTLHKENSEKHHFSHKLNHPSENSHSRTMKTPFDDFDGEIFHHSAHHKDHPQKKHFSPLDLEIFDRLLVHGHQKQDEKFTLSHLLNPENKHASLLDMMKSEDKQREDKARPFAGNDLGYPMDTFDFRSVIPTHRLFLGEPSTVSEIMDQDFSEESEDNEDERLKEGKDPWLSAGEPSVIAVPFTATERFVWDWQAVALTSAVAACLLFFAVVAGYSILHARQWRRLKTNFDTDAEELSVKMGLMQSHSVASSAADSVNTNLYLENLLETQKKKTGNIYTQKRPQS